MSRATTMPAPPRPPRVPKTPPPQVIEDTRISALGVALTKAAGAPGRQAELVDGFWAEVASIGTPLVEPIPGDPKHRAVTFVWRDRHRDGGRSTRSVALLANKFTDPSVWDQSVLEHVPGTDIWHRTYRVPAAWRATYQLAPDDGDIPAAAAQEAPHGPRSRWAGVATSAVPDPFCRTHFAGKPGEQPTSVVELDEAPPQPWWRPRPGVARGSTTEHVVPTSRLAAPRRVWVYEPHAQAAGAPGGHPPRAAGDEGADLLLLLDGEDWAGRLDLPTTLDNLVAAGAIRPTVAVLVDAIDTPARWRDLTCDDAFVDFLIADLLPWARAAFDLSTQAARTTISGRSLGGITALYAGLKAPEELGAVHAQSPSLWYPAERTDDGRSAGWLRDALLNADRLPAQLSIEVGRQEWMLLEPARELAQALELRADTATRYSEYEGGHDAYCWRGGLAEALIELAGPR